jgi:hypothetical protein
MIELFVTSKDFFSVYFSDLNVPIAYIVLTIVVFSICSMKKVPFIRSFFLWIFCGFGTATLFDAVYDYTVKIAIFHNMSLGEGLLFLLFPIPVYALMFYVKRYGKLRYFALLLIPMIFEVYISFIPYDYSAINRYMYVLMFINIIHNLNEKN